MSFSGTQKVADHHNSGCNADPHLERTSVRRPQPGNTLCERKTGANRLLRVVLVRLRVSKIRKHGVAHVLRDEAVLELDRLRAGLPAIADRRPHLLGIESRGQRRRANEVGEHHGQLARSASPGKPGAGRFCRADGCRGDCASASIAARRR